MPPGVEATIFALNMGLSNFGTQTGLPTCPGCLPSLPAGLPINRVLIGVRRDRGSVSCAVCLCCTCAMLCLVVLCALHQYCVAGKYLGAALLRSLGGVEPPGFQNIELLVFLRSCCRALPIFLIPFLVPDGSPEGRRTDWAPSGVQKTPFRSHLWL
jgi:hypothetical protein